ncbi:MAG TPA: branched-chain amino acid ABC transporter permease [Candidatus Tectomicrobia bacterium]|nr:branched-chain amino acid ABC transporter permease [Candidatus Tectomicrobia bacterium]
MERLLQYALAGVSAGSLYALVALGIVLIYRSTRVLNFAHGDIATLATFVAFSLLSRQVDFVLALAGALATGAAVGVAFYFLVLVRAQRRGATLLGMVILTLGLALVIQGVVVYVWGAEPAALPFPISDVRTYRLGGVVVSQLSLATMTAGVVGSLALYLLVQRTRLGLAMRATSENVMAAQTLGIPTRLVLGVAWGVASALGVVAGVFLAPALLLDPFFMLDPFLKGFAAAVLGGLNSLPGAVVGGLLLGVAESLAGAYLTIQFKNTLAFVVIVVVLLVRPEGLLGRAVKERV